MPHINRVVWGAVLAGLAVFVTFSPPVSACAPSRWFLFPPGACIASPSTIVVNAGNYGDFFPDRVPTGCTASLASVVFVDPGMPVFSAPGSAPASWPCQGGSCSTDIDLVSGTWAVVLDFPDSWHADSVAATTLAAAGASFDVAVLPFGPKPIGGCDGYTDLDLMVSLAQLAEKVDTGAIAAPAAINISLGRLPQAGNPVDTKCDESLVSCQVSLLLAHLAQKDPNGTQARTALIAAFGNERRELFPASLKHVHSVAAVDLAVFTDLERSKPAWESSLASSNAKELSALMPGAALCLEEGGDTWSPPAGSSFSSGYFSGVITAAMAAKPQMVRELLVQPETWQLRELCDRPGCGYLLEHGTKVVGSVSVGAGELMDSAIHGDLSKCGPTTAPGLPLRLNMWPVPGDPLAGVPSLGEHLIATIKPAPQPDPCVPCTLSCQRIVVSPLTFSKPGISRAGIAKVAPNPRIPVVLTIDTHESWALSDDLKVRISEVYVRFDDEYHYVDLTADELKMLTLGQIASLDIYGSLARLEANGQPSFITVIDISDPKLGVGVFWKSAPMVMRPPPPVP